MQIEEIVQQLGGFGRYQKQVLILLSLIAIPNAWHAIASVFIAASTDHWCSVPSVQGLNCTDLVSECLEKKKNLTIPHTIEDGSLVFEQCYRYNDSEIDVNRHGVTWNGNVTTEVTLQNNKAGCANGWDYDHSQFESTTVQSFDLVCDRSSLPNLATSIFFAGVLCGSFFFGTLSDWVGRYPTFFICVGIEAVVGIIAALSPNFSTFVAMRFFIGMTNSGSYMAAFVLGTELVGPEYRALAGTIIALFFSIGYMLLALLAYFIRDWRHLQLVISAPLLLFFILMPFISESTRWLITVGKYDRAEKVIRKAEKVNKVKLPDPLFDEQDLTGKNEVKFAGTKSKPTPLDLFRTPNLRLKTINILYNWFVNNLVYYGLSLSTSGLGVDAYTAAFVSGAVEFPAYLSCWFIIQRIGRRLPLFGYMVVGGVACLLCIVIPAGVGRTAVAMVGKFCISASFNLVYIFSAEIYPTNVRSIGMGLSSMSARVSGILSPIILLLANYWEPLPLTIFGVSSILAGVFVLALPETLGHELPQTLEEGEEFGKGKCTLGSCLQNSEGNYKPAPQAEDKTDQNGKAAEEKV